MTRYQRIAWEELESIADLTPVEINGKIYSVKYEQLFPIFSGYAFSAILQDLTATYFITMIGKRESPGSLLEKTIEKALKNRLPILVSGFYRAPSHSLDVKEIKIENDKGRLSITNAEDSTLSFADQGKLSLKK